MTNKNPLNLRRTPLETALLLAVIAKRSGRRFAKVGKETLKITSGRERFSESIIAQITAELYELGYEVVRLSQLTWVLISCAQVESASKTVTVKRWLTDDEKDALEKGLPLEIGDLEDELEDDSTTDERDEGEEA